MGGGVNILFNSIVISIPRVNHSHFPPCIKSKIIYFYGFICPLIQQILEHSLSTRPCSRHSGYGEKSLCSWSSLHFSGQRDPTEEINNMGGEGTF